MYVMVAVLLTDLVPGDEEGGNDDERGDENMTDWMWRLTPAVPR
jgi:hypothetical protein